MPTHWETIFRAFFAFIALILTAKVISQKLTVLIGVAVGAIVGFGSLDRAIPFEDLVLTLACWALFTVVISFLNTKSVGFRTLTAGKPTELIKGGKILDQNLKKARMTANDMMSLLRTKDIFKVGDVEFAVLEPDGTVSVMKKSGQQPLTPIAQGIAVEDESEPTVLIMDGEVIPQHLERTGYTYAWLLGEIQKQGAFSYDDVFLAQVDAKGNLYVDLFNDPIKPQAVKSRKLLLSSLKKTQADLESFALQTENDHAKSEYAEMATSLENIINQMEPYLRE